MEIKNKVAIVTGAGGNGSGRAIACRLAREGAVVVVSDIAGAGGRETVRRIEAAGGQAAYCGALYATRFAMDAMRRAGGGAIVNVSSVSALWHGRKRPGGFPTYDAAKAGVIRLTTMLASLAEKDHIRVNCLVDRGG